MALTPQQHERLQELVCQLRDETITPAAAAELEQLVLGNEEARRFYVRSLGLVASLRWMHAAEAGAGAALEPVVEPAVVPFPGSSPRYPRWASAAAAAVLAAYVGIAWWMQTAGVGQPVVAAVLTRASGCVWEAAPVAAGHELGPNAPLVAGRLVLTAGVAELTFRSGAVVVLEAPADLELISPVLGYLRSGRLVARVDDPSAGFTIETPHTRVLDLGTEFGVGVEQGGSTLVQVFHGKVETDSKGVGGDKRLLLAGEALEYRDAPGEKPHELKFTPARFVRKLPDPPRDHRGEPREEGLIPLNKQRVTSIDVVRAERPLVIDGNLSEWNLQAGFRSECAEPYGADYHVSGYMMYDDQNLYIAAQVGDPAPMSSIIDPAADPSCGWKGGSVQVRLATDKSLGWPLKGEAYWISGKGNRPEDLSRNLMHITMWYYQPGEQAVLFLEHGMNFRGKRTNPEGYRGAFQKQADGRGYTLEYSIPWTVLNATSPPQPGDIAGSCWNVHWSDEGGRLWKGYIVDVLNPEAVRGLPDNQTRSFVRGVTWGQAKYRPAGWKPEGE